MKSPLILLNCLLAGGVCFAFISNIKTAAAPEQVTAVKRTGKRTVASSRNNAAAQTPAPTAEENLQTIINASVLNPNRSPNTGVRGRNRRVQLSLVGTFKIGKSEGAIIRVRGAVRQNRFMQMGGNFGPGMQGMPGMPGGDGSDGFAQPGNTGSRRITNTIASGRGGMMSGQDNRMRFTSMFRQMTGEHEDDENDSAETGTKQYVKVGETLTSGHTLVEVQRFKVILSRGGTKSELLLEDPSKNQVRRTYSRRLNANQRFMQNQLNTQRQMMQMMQRMSWGMNRAMNNLNRSIQGGSGGRGGGRR